MLTIFEKAFTDGNWLVNILDIAIITTIFFLVIKLIQNSKAIQLIKSVVVLVVLYLSANLLKMQGCQYLFKMIFDNIFLILIVVFAPEIRGVLENIGRKKILRNGFKNFFSKKDLQFEKSVDEICSACKNMAKEKTGALIIVERDTLLGDIAETGKIIKGEISSELIQNIFFHNAPLHDGALIIKDNQIYAAGCILPVSNDPNIKSKYGTRHRAGIGLSEQSDCLSIIVSEETGHISMAEHGKLTGNITPEKLKEELSKQRYQLSKSDNKDSSVDKEASK